MSRLTGLIFRIIPQISAMGFLSIFNQRPMRFRKLRFRQERLVTQAGSNTFAGSLYDYLQNSALNANYYFNNQAGLPRSRVMLNRFGGRLGGPIVRDKAFFFVNYEEYRLPESLLRQ